MFLYILKMIKIFVKYRKILALVNVLVINVILLNTLKLEANQFSIRKPNALNSLGVNIHFTQPSPGEMLKISQSGVRWVRMDFDWSQTERKASMYDFSAYGRLISECEKYNIKILFILGYANSLYDNGYSPSTALGRKAFSKWVAAAVKKFKGRGILWELYNEPNVGFWQPKPNVKHYILLAKSVGNAIHAVSVNEQYIGPAGANIDLPFLEECFKADLLSQWSAVSIHPYRYRDAIPESVVPEYDRLKLLISKYSPKNKKVPILSGEWGYTTQDTGVTLQVQAKYLARQWLINLSNDIPLSIWYDWRNDGNDPNNHEQNFGMIFYDHSLKPAYFASKTLTATLKDLDFYKRIRTGNDNEYILLFKKLSKLVVVAWVTNPNLHQVEFEVSGSEYRQLNYLGSKVSTVNSKSRRLRVTLDDSPQYFIQVK